MSCAAFRATRSDVTLFHGVQLALALLALSYSVWVVWFTVGIESVPDLPVRVIKHALQHDARALGAVARTSARGSVLSQCVDETTLESTASESDLATTWIGCVADARDRALFRVRPLRLIAFVASSTGIVGALFYAQSGIGHQGSPAVAHATLAMINGTLLSAACLVARGIATASIVRTVNELFKVQRSAGRLGT